MVFKRIATRMLTFILPVITVAMLVMTGISASSSKQIIDSQIAENMKSELKAQDKAIEGKLRSIMVRAESTANAVSTGYKMIEMAAYEKMLAQSISSDDMVLGSGIWFEPYAYDKEEKYVGPYVYKKDGKITTTYEYSNATYDYFSQPYYTSVNKQGKLLLQILIMMKHRGLS